MELVKTFVIFNIIYTVNDNYYSFHLHCVLFVFLYITSELKNIQSFVLKYINSSKLSDFKIHSLYRLLLKEMIASIFSSVIAQQFNVFHNVIALSLYLFFQGLPVHVFSTY